MKVDYSFYTDTYGGNRILKDDWKRISQKAEQRLDSYTFGRCSGDWEGEIWCNRAKCAVCEMSEISYDTGKSLDSMLYDAVQVYLGDTGLLYAGVGCVMPERNPSKPEPPESDANDPSDPGDFEEGGFPGGDSFEEGGFEPSKDGWENPEAEDFEEGELELS